MEIDDAEDLYEYASDPATSEYTLWDVHKSINDTEQFLLNVISRYNKNLAENWCIVEKKSGCVIGTCGFVYWNPDNYYAEVGFALSPVYWRRGYMTEALNRVIEFGFEVMNLNRIEARCMLDNIGSAKVMEKVGMRYEGILRHVYYIKGSFLDLKMYSIIRDDLR